jgi:hypothetical protein
MAGNKGQWLEALRNGSITPAAPNTVMPKPTTTDVAPQTGFGRITTASPIPPPPQTITSTFGNNIGDVNGNMAIAQLPKPNTSSAAVAKDVNVHIPKEERPDLYEELFWAPLRKFGEQLKKGEMAYAHMGENQVRGPRDKSANDRSAIDTLRYSRLVDRLNNRVYLDGFNPGSVSHGWKVSRGTPTPMQLPDVYQMPKVETAESRSQERNEAYEAKKRSAEMQRQEDYKNYDLANNALFQQARAGKMTGSFNAELERAQALYNEQLFAQKYARDDAFKRSYDSFIAQLGLDKQSAQYNKLVQIWKDPAGGSQFAQMFANLIGSGIVPNELNAITNTMAKDVYNKMRAGQYDDAADALVDFTKKYTNVGVELISTFLDDSAPTVKTIGQKAQNALQELFQ